MASVMSIIKVWTFHIAGLDDLNDMSRSLVKARADPNDFGVYPVTTGHYLIITLMQLLSMIMLLLSTVLTQSREKPLYVYFLPLFHLI